MLQFVAEQGGEATLATMHAHSEATFFVAHQTFSRLMEEMTDGGALTYDFDSGVASLTEAGRAEIA